MNISNKDHYKKTDSYLIEEYVSLWLREKEREKARLETPPTPKKPAAEPIDSYWLKFGTGYQTGTNEQWKLRWHGFGHLTRPDKDSRQKKMAEEHQGLNQNGNPRATESSSTNEGSPLSPQQTSRPRDWVVVVRTWMQECGEPGNGNQEDRQGSPTITRKDWTDSGAAFCQVPLRLRGSQSRSTEIYIQSE
ncbi:hypothetical protein Bbelb_133410 [Branchiostoma belcheri]|nr:hypothetical protein Bbelb_133410 [Branchiostoma belcheri]